MFRRNLLIDGVKVKVPNKKKAEEAGLEQSVDEFMRGMLRVLDEQNVPETDRWAIIPARMTRLLKKSDLKDASDNLDNDVMRTMLEMAQRVQTAKAPPTSTSLSMWGRQQDEMIAIRQQQQQRQQQWSGNVSVTPEENNTTPLTFGPTLNTPSGRWRWRGHE